MDVRDFTVRDGLVGRAACAVSWVGWLFDWDLPTERRNACIYPDAPQVYFRVPALVGRLNTVTDVPQVCRHRGPTSTAAR